jgi:ADP-ribose pyrophosphatase
MNSNATDYYIIHKDVPSVFVVAYVQNKILLIKQYRQQIRQEVYEIPAGACDIGESLEDATKRELAEETGYSPHKIQTLCHLYTAPGISDLGYYVMLATDCTKGETNREISEDIVDQQFFTVSQVKKMILDGKIVEGPTISALHYFFLYQNV